MSDTFTYEGYLETWEDHFGEAESGEVTIYRFGRPHTLTITKMSEEEHAKAVADWDRLHEELNRISYEDPEADDILHTMFPIEAKLFT